MLLAPRPRATLAELEEFDALAREPLDAEGCGRIAALAHGIPGRRREACELLSTLEPNAPLLNVKGAALLDLPPETPGRIEAVYRLLRLGARRPRIDGGIAPAMLALEFRRSRAADFTELLSQCAEHFAEQLERLELKGRLTYRVRVDPLGAARGGPELQARWRWVHAKAYKRAGTRMWINGWSFDREGPLSLQAQPHLAAAWFDWASGMAQLERRQSKESA